MIVVYQHQTSPKGTKHLMFMSDKGRFMSRLSSSTKKHSKFNLYSHAQNMEPWHSSYNRVIIRQHPPQKADFPLEKLTNFMCLLHLFTMHLQTLNEDCILSQLWQVICLQGQTPPATVHMLGLECVLHWSRLWLQPYWCGRFTHQATLAFLELGTLERCPSWPMAMWSH